MLPPAKQPAGMEGGKGCHLARTDKQALGITHGAHHPHFLPPPPGHTFALLADEGVLLLQAVPVIPAAGELGWGAVPQDGTVGLQDMERRGSQQPLASGQSCKVEEWLSGDSGWGGGGVFFQPVGRLRFVHSATPVWCRHTEGHTAVCPGTLAFMSGAESSPRAIRIGTRRKPAGIVQGGGGALAHRLLIGC